MEFRTRYSKSLPDSVTGFKCEGHSMAKQSFKDECDINNILKRYEQTGILPEIRQALEGQYGDFSQVADYQNALNSVLLAEEMFAALPAKVRDKFQNNPQGFVEFCMNPKNKDELIALGLANVQEAKPVASTPSTGVPQKGDTGGASKTSE